MPYVPVGGTRLYYEETGFCTGRPFLLLHAALQTGSAMEPLSDLLSPLGFCLIAPDQRGHGRSANPSPGFTVARLADDMAELLDRLEIRRPLVAGFSLGGIVAIELARRNLVDGLVVLASRIHPDDRGREIFHPDSIRARTPRWVQQLAVNHVATPWQELALGIGEMLETWSGFGAQALGAIRCPTLVVQGDRDEMVPVVEAYELAGTIPQARLVVIPGCTHPDLLYRHRALQALFDFAATVAGGNAAPASP